MVPVKAAAILENVDQSNNSNSVTELNGFLKQITGWGNYEEYDACSWLDCDVGFQLMIDDESIAQTRKPNSDDENSESDEDEVMRTDTYESFAKGTDVFRAIEWL